MVRITHKKGGSILCIVLLITKYKRVEIKGDEKLLFDLEWPIVSLSAPAPSLIPRPLERGRGRAWYTLRTHAPGAPEKSGGIAYYRLRLRFTHIVYFIRLFVSISEYYVSERNNT